MIDRRKFFAWFGCCSRAARVRITGCGERIECEQESAQVRLLLLRGRRADATAQ